MSLPCGHAIIELSHSCAIRIGSLPSSPMRDDGTPDWLAPRAGLLAHAWGDRDLGWLEFNRRVLHEAQDPRTPLLERLKFLAIFTANLDEFTMKRVGVLRGKAQAESEDDPFGSASGSTIERLATIRLVMLDMLQQQATCYAGLRAKLRDHGIVIADWDELTESQREEA